MTIPPCWSIAAWSYVRAELAPAIDSLHSFVTHGAWTLAMVKGFGCGPSLDAVLEDLRKRGRVVEYADAKVVARLIALGRADALLASPFGLGAAVQGRAPGGSCRRRGDPRACHPRRPGWLFPGST